MQINNTSTTSIAPAQPQSIKAPTHESNATTQSTPEAGVQVSISAQAQQLAQTDKTAPTTNAQPEHLPSRPEKALTGEKLELAVQIKKAQMQYQVASDALNIASNNSNGISAPSAYYLSKNEDAREFVLDSKAQQQTINNMQAYQEQTASLNERYS